MKKYIWVSIGICAALSVFFAVPNQSPLEQEISDYIDDAKEAGDITSAGVLVRSLHTTREDGVNEDKLFPPGSSLKMPVLMVFLKNTETNPGLLGKRLSYDPKRSESQTYKPQTLAKGTYPADQLLRQLIVESDNSALIPIAAPYEKDLLAFYTSYGMHIDPKSSSEDVMTPKIMVQMYEDLYNGWYLSRASSDEALRLLSATKFNAGIVAGVPKDIRVAHKFGEYSKAFAISGRSAVAVYDHTLNDCGIVYAETPYTICITTKGRDWSRLEQTIQSISRMAYESYR